MRIVQRKDKEFFIETKDEDLGPFPSRAAATCISDELFPFKYVAGRHVILKEYESIEVVDERSIPDFCKATAGNAVGRVGAFATKCGNAIIHPGNNRCTAVSEGGLAVASGYDSIAMSYSGAVVANRSTLGVMIGQGSALVKGHGSLIADNARIVKARSYSTAFITGRRHTFVDLMANVLLRTDNSNAAFKLPNGELIAGETLDPKKTYVSSYDKLEESKAEISTTMYNGYRLTLEMSLVLDNDYRGRSLADLRCLEEIFQ